MRTSQYWEIWESPPENIRKTFTWRQLSVRSARGDRFLEPRVLLESEKPFDRLELCVRDMKRCGCPGPSGIHFRKGRMPEVESWRREVL